MALIHCPECGKEISNMTQACPNCGKPIQKDTYVLGYYSSANAFQWKDFFVILLTYFLYGAVSYCMASVIDYIHGIYQAVTSLELIERKK